MFDEVHQSELYFELNEVLSKNAYYYFIHNVLYQYVSYVPITTNMYIYI